MSARIAPHDAGPGLGQPSTILVVAMGASIHAARWLNMVRVPGLRFVLLAIYDAPINAALRNWRSVRTASDVAALRDDEIGVFESASVDAAAAAALNRDIDYETWRPSFIPADVAFAQPLHLIEAIRRFRPRLIHSMEVQMAGYLCLATRRRLGAEFPFWLLSNWGSDIFLYRKLEEHRPRLRDIARTVDAYLAECRRDTALVRQMGFRGVMLPPTPASGGANFEELPGLEELAPPSKRREIVVKGYHGWSGRGLHILAALQIAAPAVRGFRIRITLASQTVLDQAAALRAAAGLDVICDDYIPSHAEALGRLGAARMAIGFGISDGISTTLLESTALGAFPIQANASCAAEWIEDGVSGFLLSPHDVQGLASAIARASSDDALVDAAAPRNRAIVEERWDERVNGRDMIQRYRALIAAAATRGG